MADSENALPDKIRWLGAIASAVIGSYTYCLVAKTGFSFLELLLFMSLAYYSSVWFFRSRLPLPNGTSKFAKLTQWWLSRAWLPYLCMFTLLLSLFLFWMRLSSMTAANITLDVALLLPLWVFVGWAWSRVPVRIPRDGISFKLVKEGDVWEKC